MFGAYIFTTVKSSWQNVPFINKWWPSLFLLTIFVLKVSKVLFLTCLIILIDLKLLSSICSVCIYFYFLSEWHIINPNGLCWEWIQCFLSLFAVLEIELKSSSSCASFFLSFFLFSLLFSPSLPPSPYPSLLVLEVELRASFLLDRHYTTWATPSAFFAFFLRQGLNLCLGQPEPGSCYLCFPAQLGWQACTITPSHWLKWDIMNFFPRLALNCDFPNLRLSNS
jgi:hypothetical protein